MEKPWLKQDFVLATTLISPSLHLLLEVDDLTVLVEAAAVVETIGVIEIIEMVVEIAAGELEEAAAEDLVIDADGPIEKRFKCNFTTENKCSGLKLPRVHWFRMIIFSLDRMTRQTNAILCILYFNNLPWFAGTSQIDQASHPKIQALLVKMKMRRI